MVDRRAAVRPPGQSPDVRRAVFGPPPAVLGDDGLAAARSPQASRRRPVTLGVFFSFLPYAYVFLFGRGLPWWAYALALIVVAVGGAHALKEIRRRLSQESL